MSLNATIARLTDPDNLLKTFSEWAVPAATIAALGLSVKLLVDYTRNEKRPPVVFSWVPWYGSEWTIEKDPDAFFEKAQKKYAGGIFGVKAAGQTFYYVTSLPLIEQIYKQPQAFSISTIQKSWTKNVFDFGPNFVHQIGPEQHGAHMRRSFSPNHIIDLVESFDTHLQAFAKKAVVPKESVSLIEWLMRLAYRSTGAADYGPTWDAEGTYDALQKFDENVWKVALGYPPELVEGFVQARDKLIAKAMVYVENPHDAGHVIAGTENLARDGGMNERDVAKLLSGAFWPLMANVPWASIWVLIFQLQQPEGVAPLITELDAAGTRWEAYNKGKYTDHLAAFFQSSANVPLLSSTISETLRIISDSYSMRGVLLDTVELGGYTFKKNETIVCRTRSVHLDDREFDHASDYVPTRFMSDEEGKTTEGSAKWMPYGGGVSTCLGRHFAAYHMKIFLATVLKNFTFEIDVGNSDLPITLSNLNRGFGLRRPKGEVFVKVKRI